MGERENKGNRLVDGAFRARIGLGLVGCIRDPEIHALANTQLYDADDDGGAKDDARGILSSEAIQAIMNRPGPMPVSPALSPMWRTPVVPLYYSFKPDNTSRPMHMSFLRGVSASEHTPCPFLV